MDFYFPTRSPLPRSTGIVIINRHLSKRVCIYILFEIPRTNKEFQQNDCKLCRQSVVLQLKNGYQFFFCFSTYSTFLNGTFHLVIQFGNHFKECGQRCECAHFSESIKINIWAMWCWWALAHDSGLNIRNGGYSYTSTLRRLSRTRHIFYTLAFVDQRHSISS